MPIYCLTILFLNFRGGPQLQPELEPIVQQACHANFDLKQSALRIGEDCVYDRQVHFFNRCISVLI